MPTILYQGLWGLFVYFCITLNCDELYLKLKNEINSMPGSFILLAKLHYLAEGATAEMPAFLQSPEGRAAFYKAVMRLVSEQLSHLWVK
jgi:hypothetical protein